MSFSQADFFPFKIIQNPWSNTDNLMSTSTPGTSEAPRPLDLSTMNTAHVGNAPPLSQYPNPDQFAERIWYESYHTNGIPQLQHAPYYDFPHGQYATGENHGNAAPIPLFQGNIIGQGYFQGQERMPARPKDSNKAAKRRGRLPKNDAYERSQKRKRITTKTTVCDYRNGTVCDEECHSAAGSASTCCSSCSDGLPCEDPHCAIPCAESSCEKPICPEDCPISTDPQGQQMQFQQGFVPSSERISFLQQTNAEPWNPVGSRNSPSVKDTTFGSCIDPALTDPELNSQYNPERKSSNPPTPSMAQNMATPFSPEGPLQTPQFMGNGPQAPYPNEASAVVGAGGMFNSPMDDWGADNFANVSHASSMFNCPWDACNEFIPDEQSWTQHLHQAHLDPQYTYGCPLQSNDCPSTLGTNPLNHLQTQHGFDMNENNFSCPAPTCSPAETYNDPAIFHNHFDQAHAIPAQGFLHCRLHSCNGSFVDQNKLLSHINESHQLSIPPPKVEINVTNQTEAANYPLAIPDNELLVAHVCKWKHEGGGVCGETCATEKDLQDHVKIKHLAILSKSTGYICQWEHCGRPAKMGSKQGFSQRGKLERHMASHTNCKSLYFVH
jgi:hypothetical protein